jgi:hypothetical protein
MTKWDSGKDRLRHSRRTRGLVGYWGHTLSAEDTGEYSNLVDDGAGGIKALRWQFQVERQLRGGMYAVVTFSWWDGSSSSVEVLSEKDLIDPSRCRLYPDREAMCDAYDKVVRLNRQRRGEPVHDY